MGNGMMTGVGSMFGGGMYFGPLLMIAVLLFVVFGIAAIFKADGNSTNPTQSAKQILDARLAAGEIDSTEYAELKHHISA